MRSDSIGMFWEDIQRTRGDRSNIVRPMPYIPDTGWVTPNHYPDLSRAPVICVDVETYEPDFDNGPGWARGKGHLVGIAIGVPGHKWYFPIRHTVEPEYNMDPEMTLHWLRDMLETPHIPKVGANLIYDIGWLRQEGVHVKGKLVDVQYAEALLAEDSKVALEVLGHKYLREGKETSLLYNWCKDFYGGSATDQRKNIWRAPPRLVGPYAEMDADLPLRVAYKQFPLLQQEGLLNLFEMECDLIYLLIEMRFAGVTVNTSAAQELRDVLLARENTLLAGLKTTLGFPIRPSAAADLERAFKKVGIDVPRTEKGAPSIKKDWLATVDHPIAKDILEIRKLGKLRGTFVESYILDSHVDGKVYGQFHSLRSDEGGTRSGRLSSSQPNLQNLPSRDEDLAPLVRGMFIPDTGHLQWRRFDYSQIEYRFLAHFAVGPGADEVRDHYNKDPNTDYHEITQRLIHEKTSQMLGRKQTKNINFGLCIAAGQLVLTNKGLVPIQDVRLDHLLWDGIEWVSHEGVIYKGKKEVIRYDGLTATPDHRVFHQRDGMLYSLEIMAKYQRKIAVSAIGGWPIAVKRSRSNIAPFVGALKHCGYAEVYDILNAGPRHRFTCEGRLVSNCYGMGVPHLAEVLSLTIAEAKKLFAAYHEGVPFVKATMDATMREAQQTGIIKTILGRKSRFDLWEPADYNSHGLALPRMAAQAAYGNIKRAYTHKALNRRLQGSAADMMKMAMLKAYKDGLFDHIGYPRLTVHDELDFSDPGGVDDGFAELKNILENVLPLRIPIRADEEMGPDWGHVK